MLFSSSFLPPSWYRTKRMRQIPSISNASKSLPIFMPISIARVSVRGNSRRKCAILPTGRNAALCGKRYGLQTMCEGGGQANVTIIERL